MEIPRHVFKHKDAATEIMSEEGSDDQVAVTKILSVSFHKGIFVNYEGGEFAQRGMATPEIMASVNIMKALFMGAFKLRPTLNSILSFFNRIGMKVLRQFVLKEEYRMASMRELEWIIYRFLNGIGVDKNVSSETATFVSHLIEYDNAYRLRIIDIASETSKEELIKNPRKEINRLLELVYKREIKFDDVKDKFKYVAFALKLLLLRPKYKKAFRLAIEQSDWSKMQYDNTDRYWACLRTDYNFMGANYPSRLAFLEENGFKAPVQRKMAV